MRKFLRYYPWIVSVGLVVAGIVSISNLILSKKPELKDKLEKITPYAGYIGAGMLVCGIWGLIDGLIWGKWYTSNMGIFFKAFPVMQIALIAFPPICIVLGALQGLPQIAKWTGKDLSNVEEITKKVAPYQVPFGIAGIIVGFLLILFLLRITF